MSHSHATPHTPRVDRGIVLAIFAAVAFGASTPFSKQLLHSLDPALTAGLLYLGSGVGLAALLLVRRVRNVTGEPGLARADVPWMTGAVVFGGLFAPLALMTGLRATPASSAALLLNLEAVFTALLAWVVFRENVGRRVAIGMVAIVAAGALLSWSGP